MSDINRNSLDFAARRIARHTPKNISATSWNPVSIAAAHFDSVGINYLLLCLPRTIAAKTVLLDHLKALMNPNAVLFGLTLFQGGVSRSWLARRLMSFYNRKGIFSNRHDDPDGLKQASISAFTMSRSRSSDARHSFPDA